MWILAVINGISLQKSENMFCLSRLMWRNCSTANFLTLQYKIQHNTCITKMNTDSDRHIQHTAITRLQAYFIPHQHMVSFRYFVSEFSVTVQAHIPYTTPEMILICRHTLFYWPVTKLSALSIWNLVYSSWPVSIQFASHLWPKVPKGLMPANSLTLAPSCLV